MIEWGLTSLRLSLASVSLAMMIALSLTLNHSGLSRSVYCGKGDDPIRASVICLMGINVSQNVAPDGILH